jgi:hypothetical protein
MNQHFEFVSRAFGHVESRLLFVRTDECTILMFTLITKTFRMTTRAGVGVGVAHAGAIPTQIGQIAVLSEVFLRRNQLAGLSLSICLSACLSVCLCGVGGWVGGSCLWGERGERRLARCSFFLQLRRRNEFRARAPCNKLRKGASDCPAILVTTADGLWPNC